MLDLERDTSDISGGPSVLVYCTCCHICVVDMKDRPYLNGFTNVEV